MIQEFVNRFMANKHIIEASFAEKHPADYKDIVKKVINAISDGYDYDCPDPDNIHVIDDGDYQGTLLYVIPEKGYQPSVYWYVMVNYGSCSGCDTLQGISAENWDEDPPTKSQVDQYMTLALHIIQRLKQMYEDK